MVDNPEELTEVEMYRDPATGKLIGRDPETGDTFPIPFDQISANSVQSDTAQVDGTATVDALEAADVISAFGVYGVKKNNVTVDTTATVVHTLTDTFNSRGVLTVSYAGGGSQSFADRLLYDRSDVDLMGSVERSSSPVRSYSTDEDRGEILLALDEGEEPVNVIVEEVTA